MNMQETLAVIEIGTFVLLIAGFGYSRLVSWRRFDQRTTKVEGKVEVMERDLASFIRACDLCRGDVRKHHESITMHVNSAFNDRINEIAVRVMNVEAILMEMKRNGG